MSNQQQQRRSIEPSQTDWLKAQIGKLMLLRFAPKEEQQLVAFRQACEQMCARYGQSRFAAAVHKCVSTAIEFPMPSELEALVPTPEGMNGRCPRCKSTEGWVYVTAVHPQSGREYECVTRCTHGAA